MQFRIGINLGDVIEDDGRIYGDGVNITARLEGFAKAGGICISGPAYDQVKNKISIGYEFLGEHVVKNIKEPVRIYRVLVESESKAEIDTEEKIAPPLPEKPSVAVLPFTNMSADPEQEYFSDGLTEDLITDLSKISGLFVIARNSIFTYKGRPVKIQQVSKDLGVRYVLEGSVRKAGQRMRITAQLVDALTGHHLWAERYDRNLEDIFAVQDEITEEIVSVPPALYFNVLGVSYRESEQYEEAISTLKERMSCYPDFIMSRYALITTYCAAKRYEEARAEAREIFKIDPRFNLEQYTKRLPYKDREVNERLLTSLLKADLL